MNLPLLQYELPNITFSQTSSLAPPRRRLEERSDKKEEMEFQRYYVPKTPADSIVHDVFDLFNSVRNPISKQTSEARDYFHERAPLWVFDNSARIIAGHQLLGEYFMAASSGMIPGPVKVEGFKGFTSWSDTWNKISGQVKEPCAGKWRLFSTITGTAMFGATAIFNPAPAAAEEEQRMGEKWRDDKLGYIGERTLQIFSPDINARQTLGLGFMMVGVFSGKCGLVQHQEYKKALEDVAKGIKDVKPKPGAWKEIFAAGLSLVSGFTLTYSADDETGWRRFGVIMPMRLLTTAPRSVQVARDSKDYWYGAGISSFQLMNVFSYLIGGVDDEKLKARSQKIRPGDMMVQREAEASAMPALDAPTAQITTDSSHYEHPLHEIKAEYKIA